MALRQQYKQFIKNGSKVTVVAEGNEYTGTVVSFENMTPQDSHMTVELEDGRLLICPMTTTNSPFVIVPAIVEDEPESEDDEEYDEDDDELDVKAPPATPEDELINYNKFDTKELIKAAKKKKINYKKGGKSGAAMKKSELVKALIKFDKAALKNK